LPVVDELVRLVPDDPVVEVPANPELLLLEPLKPELLLEPLKPEPLLLEPLEPPKPWACTGQAHSPNAAAARSVVAVQPHLRCLMVIEITHYPGLVFPFLDSSAAGAAAVKDVLPVRAIIVKDFAHCNSGGLVFWPQVLRNSHVMRNPQAPREVPRSVRAMAAKFVWHACMA